MVLARRRSSQRSARRAKNLCVGSKLTFYNVAAKRKMTASIKKFTTKSNKKGSVVTIAHGTAPNGQKLTRFVAIKKKSGSRRH